MINNQTLPAHHATSTVVDGGQHKLHIVHNDKCGINPIAVDRHDFNGADILRMAGRPVNEDQRVFQILNKGGMEDIRLDEGVDQALGNVFVLAAPDRLFPFTVNGKQDGWPFQSISGAIVAMLAGADHNHEVELVRQGITTIIAPTELVDLSLPGIEHFKTVLKPKAWEIKVQGIVVSSETPTIVVRDAMIKAGFDVNKGWQIFLIAKNQPKQQLTLDSIVDLRAPGIEKIRLMTGNVGNGDGQAVAQRREFKLLPQDVKYLDGLGKDWETVLAGERRWLIIRDYETPEGFMPRRVNFALDIPSTYPAAQIDMFYFSPHVTLASGSEIACTQIRVVIDGMSYQAWSRHRNGSSAWDPNTDNVVTHMALVEYCMGKEIGE